MKGNGIIASHMDMERIIILMEDTTKELLSKDYHMDLEDLSMEMGIIMKVRSNMEEEMVKEFTILEESFLEDYSRIMYWMEKENRKVLIIISKDSLNVEEKNKDWWNLVRICTREALKMILSKEKEPLLLHKANTMAVS